jgi:hypothetical protein
MAKSPRPPVKRWLSPSLSLKEAETDETRCQSGFLEHRYRDSNPGFRRERAAS